MPKKVVIQGLLRKVLELNHYGQGVFLPPQNDFDFLTIQHSRSGKTFVVGGIEIDVPLIFGSDFSSLSEVEPDHFQNLNKWLINNYEFSLLPKRNPHSENLYAIFIVQGKKKEIINEQVRYFIDITKNPKFVQDVSTEGTSGETVLNELYSSR